MKKLGFLTAALWALGLLLIPQPSTAELVAMSDDDLREVTGQAGISIRTEDVIRLNIDAERFAWEHPESEQEPGAPAMFSLADVTMRGWISAPEGIDIDFIDGQTQFDDRFILGPDTHGVAIKLNNLTVAVDEFQSDMMLGDASLGKIGIYGLRANVSGNLYVFSRNE